MMNGDCIRPGFVCRIAFFLIIIIAKASLFAASQTEPKIQGKKKSSEGIHQNQNGKTASGEYLVTMSEKSSVHDIRRIFSKYSIVSVAELDNIPGVFLLKFKEDPGLLVLQNTARSSGKIQNIQPNYVYQMNSPGLNRNPGQGNPF